MQCPSCDFNNMPGMKRCARCQASLALGSVDVIPPRASKRQRAIPNWFRSTLNRIRYGAADVANDALRANRREVSFRWTLGDYLCLLVGGLQQSVHGESAGRFWLGGWIVLFILSVAFAGTGLGSVCLGLLFALHTISIADIFFRQQEEWGTRVRFMGVVTLALGLIYGGTVRTLGAYITPIGFLSETTDLNPGDVIWYANASPTKNGQLVAYDIGRIDFNYRINNVPALLRVEGTRINRQVAEAGQVVSWKNRTLFVDNKECEWQPMGFMERVADFEIPVAQGCIFVSLDGIVPENVTGMMGAPASMRTLNSNNTIDVGRIGLIPKQRILGRVFLRSFPWTSIRWY